MIGTRAPGMPIGRGGAVAGHPWTAWRRAAHGHGSLVRVRAPRVGGGYRLIVEPWRVLEILDRFAPTSVEVSDKSTLLPVTRWARRSGAGCVLFSHERLDAMVALRTGWEAGVRPGVAALNRLPARRFDAVVVTSAFAEREFTATGATVHRIPLGVDLETFHPSTRDTRLATGGSAALRLINAGRLSREKSPDLAVDVALRLHGRGVPVRLDVLGNGPMRDRLQSRARGAPVVFHGHVAGRRALAARLAAADVALSVCPGETFGLSILEALASGTPVATADRGGGRELVTQRCGGWAPPDPDRLADAVLDVAAGHPPARRTAARERAELFEWGRAADAFLGAARVGGSCRRRAR